MSFLSVETVIIIIMMKGKERKMKSALALSIINFASHFWSNKSVGSIDFLNNHNRSLFRLVCFFGHKQAGRKRNREIKMKKFAQV
jgi:hypothetical protein